MKRLLPPDLKEAAPFLLPLLGFIGAFVLIPVLGAVVNSTLRDVTFLKSEFAGLGNYAWLARNPAFWQSVKFTLLFVALSVPLQMLLGIVFALVLNEKVPLRGLLRACVLIPWVVPAAVSARIWELIYNYSFGLANFLWVATGIPEEPVNWLGTDAGAFIALVLADTWKTTPFVTVILLTGLSAIPEDIYLQAQVDGANLFKRFVKITVPLLKPAIVVALIFRTIDSLRVFDLNYVLTNGGPGGSTTSVSLHGYQYFLLGDFGYGSAVSVVLFLVALSLTLAYIKIGRIGQVIQ
ncbi:MAG: sugar ABC transporter permease [Syntrophobacteraceae bacterium]